MPQQSEDAAEVTIVDIVSFCVTQLGLQGLACLSACSRDLHSTCLGLVRSHARTLLEAAVKAVQAANKTSKSSEYSSDIAVQEQHRQAVAWLLLAVPAVAQQRPLQTCSVTSLQCRQIGHCSW
jgi:hypothetical protein